MMFTKDVSTVIWSIKRLDQLDKTRNSNRRKLSRAKYPLLNSDKFR